MAFGKKGIKTIPADKMRKAATCNGARRGGPSGKNIPIFINMNELPHMMHNATNKIHFK
jgi:hypothetical protein